MHTHTHTHLHTHLHTHMHTHMHVHMHTHMHTCTCTGDGAPKDSAADEDGKMATKPSMEEEEKALEEQTLEERLSGKYRKD